MQLSRLNLNQRGVLLIAIPIVYLAFLLAFLIQQQRQHDEAQFWAVHTKEVLLQIERVHSALAHSQSDLRAYVVTDLPLFREAYQKNLAVIHERFDGLVKMVSDNASQTPRMEIARKRIQTRQLWTDALVETMLRGERENAVENIKNLKGSALIQDILEAFDELQQAEELLDRQRLETLKRSTTFQNRILIGGLLLTAVIGFGVVRSFARWITGRIASLSENVERFSRGEPFLDQIKGHDEIFELDQRFRRMADSLISAKALERDQQRQLERQNADLLRVNENLDQKNQENEMFVYSVSHDLRSPLVNLQGFSRELGAIRDDLKGLLAGEFTQSVRERAQALVERDVSEAIHFIQAAVSRLSAIIDALLRLSRAGRVEYNPKEVDLNLIAARIVEAMRLTIDEHHVQVERLDLPKIWGDPTAIEQIMANLIANAVNYSDKNRPGRIEIGQVASNDERYIPGMNVCYVKDNGLGIAKQHLTKVFTIFQRLHGAIAPGEGVGLALVERIIKRHGGKIWVESEEGVGSTFFVAFPDQKHSLFEAGSKDGEEMQIALP